MIQTTQRTIRTKNMKRTTPTYIITKLLQDSDRKSLKQ